MTTAWTVFGLLIIVSQRYLKHLWAGKQVIHTVAAGCIFILAMGFGIKAVKVNGAFTRYWHSGFGLTTLILCLLVTIGGLLLLAVRTKTNYDWNTERLLRLRRVHRYLGYFVLLVAQVTILLGLLIF
mmetsp:Transcript_18509/g.13303  ORF Transcript_18509/g.13303 Transcript_18509/m.13303 type:complete len:127 (+) Transcript_18509:611-991(+)